MYPLQGIGLIRLPLPEVITPGWSMKPFQGKRSTLSTCRGGMDSLPQQSVRAPFLESLKCQTPGVPRQSQGKAGGLPSIN